MFVQSAVIVSEKDKEENVRNYKACGAVTKAFFASNAFTRLIMGPIGSGKSTACIIEILRRARMQAPDSDGKRRTRWLIVRNSYPELKSTTIKSWAMWGPGKISGQPPHTYHLVTKDIDMEVLFIALDHADFDVKKVLSLEITGAFINECKDVPKTIVDAITGRIGRYPAKNMGGCTWSGLIMDTNPPDTGNWIYKTFETNDIPKGWEIFKQPSGLSPEAENVENLPEGYYDRIMAGKDDDYIKVYVRGEYGFLVEGQSVFPMFRDRLHTATENIIPDPRLSLQIGIDFGLTPAAVIGQRQPNGQWRIVDELVTEDSGIIRFAETLTAYMFDNYREFTVSGTFGDPAGLARGNDERTSFDIMNAHSPWKWKPAHTKNDIPMRLEVVKAALNRLIDGQPGFLLSPKCEALRKGFSGGYHYKLLRTGDGTQTHSEPNKNRWSHVHDACQYLLLGAGEGEVVLNKMSREERRAQGPRIAKGTGGDIKW